MKLFGRNPVLERLHSNPKSISKIYLEENLRDTSFIRKLAQQKGIPVFTVPASKILKISHSRNTQGIIAETSGFDYYPYDELLEDVRGKGHSLVFLDGLTDPQNLGAVIRSLACLGKFALVIPTHDAVGITESVLRVASGGENYLSVAQVSNLANAIREAKEAGFWIFGSVVEGGQSLENTTLVFPLGLVIGSEQKGIRPVIRNLLEAEITIPMAVRSMSLNASHAASILGYEIIRQSKSQKQSTP